MVVGRWQDPTLTSSDERPTTVRESALPEQPIPEQDPVVTKSYALHYVVVMVILMGTLFWALWDEAYGQRPWKAFQQEWKHRYTAFLDKTRPKSESEVKSVQTTPETIRASTLPPRAHGMLITALFSCHVQVFKCQSCVSPHFLHF